jgi:hypothetical protein
MIAASLLAVRGAVLYANWKVDSEDYVAWQTSEGLACAAIRKSCEENEPATPADGEKPDIPEELRSTYERLTAEKSQFEREYEAFLDQRRRVEICSKPKMSAAGLSCEPRQEPILDVERVLVSPLVLYPLLVPYVFAVMRRFYAVQHLGWQRVSLVFSGLVASAMTYQVFENSLGFEDAVATLALFILVPGAAALAGPSLALQGYRWISEGFIPEKSRPESGAAVKPTEPVEPLSLSWSSMRAVLKFCGIAALLLAGLVFQPNTTIAGITVGAIVGGVVVLVRLLRKKLGK